MSGDMLPWFGFFGAFFAGVRMEVTACWVHGGRTAYGVGCPCGLGLRHVLVIGRRPRKRISLMLNGIPALRVRFFFPSPYEKQR